MPQRPSDPPSEGEAPKRPTGGTRKLKADQYELKIRWERARRVIDVTSTGVQFEFDAALKVGARYPISLTGPGVSFSATVEVTRCQMTVDETGRHFRVSGRFFPYVE